MPFYRSRETFRGRRKNRRGRTYRPIRLVRQIPITNLKFPNPTPSDYNFIVDPLFVEEEDYLQYQYDNINMQSIKNDFFDDNDTYGRKKLHRSGSLPSLNIFNEMIEMYELKNEPGYVDSREESPLYHFPSNEDPILLSKMDRKKVKRSHSLVDLRYYFIMSPETIETVALLRKFESACKLERVLYNLNFCNFRQIIIKAQELGYLTPNIIKHLTNNNIYEILNKQEVVANKISKFNWSLYYELHKKKDQFLNNINRKPSHKDRFKRHNSESHSDTDDNEDDYYSSEEEIEEFTDDDIYDEEIDNVIEKVVKNKNENDKEKMVILKNENTGNEKIYENDLISNDEKSVNAKEGKIDETININNNNNKIDKIVDNHNVVNENNYSNINDSYNIINSNTNILTNKVQNDKPVFLDDGNDDYQKTEVLNAIVEINNSNNNEKIVNGKIVDKENNSLKINQKVTNRTKEKSKNVHIINNFEEAIDIIKKSDKIVVLNGYQTISNSNVPHWKVNRNLLRKIINKYKLNSYRDIFDMDYYKKNPFPLHEYANSFKYWTYEASNSLKFIKSLSDNGKLLRCYSENIDGMEYLARIPIHQFCAVNGSIACFICKICKKHFPWNSAPIANFGYGLNLKYCEWCMAVVVPCISFQKDIKSITTKYHTLENDALQADLVLILGTSLDVSPFNLLPKLFPLIPKIMITKSFNVNTSFIPDFTCLGDPDDIVRIIDGINSIPKTIEEKVIARRIMKKSKSKTSTLLYSDQKLNFIYEKNLMRNPAKTIALKLCYNIGLYMKPNEKIYIHNRFCLFNSGEAYYLKNHLFPNKFIISPMQLRSIIPDKIYREVIRESFTFPNIVNLLNSNQSKTYETIVENMNQLMTIIRNVLEYVKDIKLTQR